MEVTLLEEGTSNNPVMSIAMAASRCYDSEPTKELVRNVLSSGHNSMAEFAAFHFNIKKGSRVFSHQLVRKRAGTTYAQRSQRYVNEDGFGYVTPDSIKKESFTHYEYDEMIAKLHDLYNQFVEMGIPKEDARFILPNSTETEIDVMINLHSLMDLSEERLCTRAQWEIRNIVWQMRNLVVQKWPIFGEFIKPKCQVIGYCPERKSCGLTIHKSEVRDLFKPGKKGA